MPRAKKICGKPGCTTATTAALCTTHARDADRARGTATQRGYGTAHINARKALIPQVATGTTKCARCNELIQPGDAWQLDHSDDRASYIGPSHKRCNLSAAGKASHQYD